MGGGPWRSTVGLSPQETGPVPWPACPSVCHTGYTLCYHSRAVSQAVNESDTKLLLRSKWLTPTPPPVRGLTHSAWGLIKSGSGRAPGLPGLSGWGRGALGDRKHRHPHLPASSPGPRRHRKWDPPVLPPLLNLGLE